MSISVILEVVAIVLFAIAAVLFFGWLGAPTNVTKDLGVVSLGLAFHAAAHIA